MLARIRQSGDDPNIVRGVGKKRKRPMTIEEFARLGGKARAKKMGKKARAASAKKAANARWKKEKGPEYLPEA